MSNNMICKKDKPDVIEAWRTAIKYREGHDVLFGDLDQSRFTKPLDYALAQFMDRTADWLCLEDDRSEDGQAASQDFLKEYCQVMAVQDRSPSESLSLIFDLKAALTVAFKDGIGMFSNGTEAKHAQNITKLHALGRKIDSLMLTAFDEFSKCRDRVIQVRYAEMDRAYGRAPR